MKTRETVLMGHAGRGLSSTSLTRIALASGLALVLGCGGGTTADAATSSDASGSPPSAHELCVRALTPPGTCLAATGSTQAECEAEVMDAIAAGCRTEVEASLSCLASAAPDPAGACPSCEAQGRVTSACLTR